MIAAFARAARVLPGSPSAGSYLSAARKAAEFVRSTLWNEQDRRLLRRYRDGEAGIGAYAEDYAYLIFGLVELFQADGDHGWLEWAVALQDLQDEAFWDADEGGWFSTRGDDPAVLLRLKEDYDGAEPAASSVSVLNLLTIGHLVEGTEAMSKVERTLARYGPRVGAAARVLPMMLCALSAWHAGLSQIVVAGRRDNDETRALLHEIARHYLPFAIVIPVEPGERQSALAERLPFVATMRAREGRATAYVCRDFTCQQPVAMPDELRHQLAPL
jgi:uncharacterized protein